MNASEEEEEANKEIPQQSLFQIYGIYLLKWPSQIFVLALTSALLAVSLWGNYELRQEFDPMWFLPKESYLSRWNQMNEKWVLKWLSNLGKHELLAFYHV